MEPRSFDFIMLSRLNDLRQEHRTAMIFRDVAEWLPEGPACTLDIGCGSGRLMALMAQHGYRAEGADILDYRITDARDLPFYACDAGALPIDGDRYDAVLLVACLHHSHSPEDIIIEAVRVTRPGGRIVVVETTSETALVKAWNYGWDKFLNWLNNPGIGKQPIQFKTRREWVRLFQSGATEIDVVCCRKARESVWIDPERHMILVFRKGSDALAPQSRRSARQTAVSSPENVFHGESEAEGSPAGRPFSRDL